MRCLENSEWTGHRFRSVKPCGDGGGSIGDAENSPGPPMWGNSLNVVDTLTVNTGKVSLFAGWLTGGHSCEQRLFHLFWLEKSENKRARSTPCGFSTFLLGSINFCPRNRNKGTRRSNVVTARICSFVRPHFRIVSLEFHHKLILQTAAKFTILFIYTSTMLFQFYSNCDYRYFHLLIHCTDL